MNPLGDFMKSAKGLTKNPLGIIGLFISLIYGFACLVLSTSISNLQSASERIPLIWFIIIFPLIILGAFIFLVVNHHEKLYAPSDFRNDDSFIETMSGKKIKEKQEKEAELLNSADNSVIEIAESKDIQREEKTEKIVESNNESISKIELSNRISDAEDWAVKDLELKYNIAFRTNQRLVSNSIKLELDAFASSPEKVIIAEIKYWHSNKAIKPLLLSLQNFILKINTFRTAFKNKEVELILVIVFDKINVVTLNKIESFLSELNTNVKLEVKEYSKLKSDYEE
jgi:ABC-type transport system involved in multi-copper enzyme maturation permease subunit